MPIVIIRTVMMSKIKLSEIQVMGISGEVR